MRSPEWARWLLRVPMPLGVACLLAALWTPGPDAFASAAAFCFGVVAGTNALARCLAEHVRRCEDEVREANRVNQAIVHRIKVRSRP